MPDGGTLRVSLRQCSDWTQGDGRSGIRINITDTGMGMTAETKQRIFEAFFTTKEATGTGLGLWVSHEIIHNHNGTIHVRSREPKDGETSGYGGTVFSVFFPD